MAGITATTTIADLKTIFNKIDEVYFKDDEITTTELGGSSAISDVMELPVLSNGVTLNTGEAEVTEIRLTTNEIWTSRAEKGDSDITFQVPSVAGEVNDLFLDNKSAAISSTILVDGKTFSGAAYSLSPKKVKGALVLMSEDKQTAIVLPAVEMYANLVAADGENPAYFNVSVTPVANSEGFDIMILGDTTA